jgi:hypothetical protein
MKIKNIRTNVIIIILLSNLLIGTGFAQAPEKFSYQAVIRDAENYLVTNADVGVQMSILQGSPGGPAVYVETHIKETNINGLLTLEIGDGTIVSGEFENIDWSDGPYFILSEIDPTGGTNYSITGSSQLLSVPYALHAKTAESTVMETDPVFTASIAAGITATDTSYWNNKLDMEVDGDTTNELQNISRTGLTVTLSHGGGSYEDSVNTYVAGMGIVIDDTVISAKTYSVGDFAHGGIVFWVDETGQHGLVCAKTNQSSGIRWYAGSYTYTLAKGNGPLAGNMNTAIIISSQGYGDGNTNAARICAELEITEDNITYGDWYLPSRREMEIMYENKEVINTTALANGGGTFASDFYWSSTEYTNNHVWVQDFDNGVPAFSWKQNLLYVRAARTF